MIENGIITFDTRGNEKQKECARRWNDDYTSDIIYGGAKGGAKSFTGCSLIFSNAFTYPGTHYFICRKKLNDLRKFTRPSIDEVFDIWGIPQANYKFNAMDNMYILHNKSKVFLLEAKYMPSDKDYARFGSMQMTRGWLEEAGEFEPDAKSNLAASVGRWRNNKYGLKGKILQTCNPAKNYLYGQYYKPFKEGTLGKNKAFIQAFPQDNKMLSKGYIEHLYETLDKNQIERLIHGSWEYDDDPTCLIDIDSANDYFTNEHILPEGDKYITVDVARLGKDKTTIRVWHGWRVIQVEEYDKTTINEVVDIVKTIANIHEVPMSRVVVDEDGVGGGVKDYLKCKGFVNNSSPIQKGVDKKFKENYDNLKSQCSFKIAKRIVRKELYEICDNNNRKQTVISEMEVVKSKSDMPVGKLGVLPKDEVRKLIGRSPDHWDSIMMREFFELRRSKMLASSWI